MDFSQIIQRWASDDSRSGAIENPDGVGEIGMEQGASGSKVAVRFFVKVNGEQLDCVRFQVYGCGFTIASCAAAAKLAEGLPIERARRISAEAIDEKLGRLPMERRYCAVIAAQALQAAITSACEKAGITVAETAGAADEEMHARVDADHPVYRKLIDSPAPAGTLPEDRHLFACLLSAASDEPWPVRDALGITDNDIEFLLQTFFPKADASVIQKEKNETTKPPTRNEEITELILTHVRTDGDATAKRLSEIMAKIISARTAHEGHLWVGMGFFERPQLTASIRRHLPTMADANNKGMRWKRFLFKALCDKTGANLCKAPTCGECSDYALCFAPD